MKKALLDGAAINQVLENIQVNDKTNGLWINVSHEMIKRSCASAGLDIETLSYYAKFPSIYIVASEALLTCINENMIYPATAQSVDDNYYLMIGEDCGLYCHYQQIVGGRFLGHLSEEAYQAFYGRLNENIREAAPRIALSISKKLAVAKSGVEVELELFSVENNRIPLPKVQLKHYAQIKELFFKAGGRYRKNCFDFEDGIDAEEVLQALQGGKKLNPKKDFQFFATPPELAKRVCLAAGLSASDRVLEPEAGEGGIADEARLLGAEVLCVEMWDINVQKLKAKGYEVLHRDFLEVSPEETGLFDAIVANPPWTGNKDIDHVLHMWSFLKPDGVLSVLMSTSWKEGIHKKHVAFRKFLEEKDLDIEEVPPGTFAKSGTQVGAVHLVIRKPYELDLPVVKQIVKLDGMVNYDLFDKAVSA